MITSLTTVIITTIITVLQFYTLSGSFYRSKTSENRRLNNSGTDSVLVWVMHALWVARSTTWIFNGYLYGSVITYGVLLYPNIFEYFFFYLYFACNAACVCQSLWCLCDVDQGLFDESESQRSFALHTYSQMLKRIEAKNTSMCFPIE